MLDALPIILGTLAALGGMICCYYIGRSDGRMSGDAHAAAFKSMVGTSVDITIKLSSDDRWRLAVGPWSPEGDYEVDADWISCGDGYKTKDEAIDLARKYWPKAHIVIDHGDRHAKHTTKTA